MMDSQVNERRTPLIPLRQDELISSWNDEVKPLVSVLCHTYQQASFISNALDGFFAQETSFPFEVIVHDDASTDSSREILADYQARYPKILRLILQDDNQFSKGEKPIGKTLAIAEGRFVSLCEGDDFWTCRDKLAIQAALLLTDKRASACFHSADDLDEQSGDFRSSRWGPPYSAYYYSIEDLLLHGTFVPTASLLFRKENLNVGIGNLSKVPHADFAVVATLLTHGPIAYIDRSMSVYRRHSAGVHSSVWGAISTVRSLKTRVDVAHALGLNNLPAYKEGLKILSNKLEQQIIRDQERIKNLEAELQDLRFTYDRARQSKFFRLGMLFDKLVKSIGKSRAGA